MLPDNSKVLEVCQSLVLEAFKKERRKILLVLFALSLAYILSFAI
jgi:hypothetical protein